MTKLNKLRKDYQQSLKRFEEILKRKPSIIVRDSALKRFEITFDLAWKLVKAYLEDVRGVKCFSPNECFRQAFQQGVIKYNDLWLRVVKWRNLAVHTYSEKLADSLYKKLPRVLKLFKELEKI